MPNENLLDILDEIAKLSDADMARFRNVLERTTLDSIIKLSSEVTNRLEFLDVLHELVYGAISKRLKERMQLHKILEPQCWIFGPKFHLATSDKSFREVIQRHREKAGMSALTVTEIGRISGIKDIPDLFLAAERSFPIEPKNQHLIVEIKAPRVKLSSKELDQIRIEDTPLLS